MVFDGLTFLEFALKNAINLTLSFAAAVAIKAAFKAYDHESRS